MNKKDTTLHKKVITDAEIIKLIEELEHDWKDSLCTDFGCREIALNGLKELKEHLKVKE